MYALARELDQRLQISNIPEAIGFCRGKTDNEARLVASSESVSRVLEIHMLDRATRGMMSMMPGTDACSKRRGRIGTQD